KAISETNIHKGIFIDIFPIDNVEPHTIKGVFQQKAIYVLREINLCRIKFLCKQINNPLKKYISLTLHYILKFIPKSYMDNTIIYLAKLLSHKETEFVSHLLNGASQKRYNKFMREKFIFNQTIDYEFEGRFFPIPRN